MSGAAILVELNADYAEQARKRCSEWWKKPTRAPEPDPAQTSLLADPR